jgi:hypothetical protein
VCHGRLYLELLLLVKTALVSLDDYICFSLQAMFMFLCSCFLLKTKFRQSGLSSKLHLTIVHLVSVCRLHYCLSFTFISRLTCDHEPGLTHLFFTSFLYSHLLMQVIRSVSLLPPLYLPSSQIGGNLACCRYLYFFSSVSTRDTVRYRASSRYHMSYMLTLVIASA